MRPYELHSCQLRCETIPYAPKRSGHRLTGAPRPGFAGRYANVRASKEGSADAGGSAIKRSAFGWFIPTRSLRSLPAHKGKAVTASSRLFRSLRLLYNRQLAVLVHPPPAPQGERINAREPQCRRDRQCPESAYINIIPSGLCNSSRERHLPLERHQYSKERCPARTSCLLRVSTIRIMLSTLRK